MIPARRPPWPQPAAPCRPGPAHRRQLTDHLLALDLADRSWRFGAAASDAYIEGYVQGIDFDSGFVLRAFEGGRMRGAAHAASGPKSGGLMLEVGLSVDRGTRRRGVGSELLRACMMQARHSAAGQVLVLYQPGNSAMAMTARSLGGTIRKEDGTVRAEFGTPIWLAVLQKEPCTCAQAAGTSRQAPGQHCSDMQPQDRDR